MERRFLNGKIDAEQINRLANDAQFLEAATTASTHSPNVKSRLDLGEYFITAIKNE